MQNNAQQLTSVPTQCNNATVLRCANKRTQTRTRQQPLKQGSHLHDLQQDFNKTKAHAVRCEEQVAVLRSEITEPLYAIALRMQHDTNLII